MQSLEILFRFGYICLHEQCAFFTVFYARPLGLVKGSCKLQPKAMRLGVTSGIFLNGYPL